MADNPRQEYVRKNVARLEKVQLGYKAEELTAKLEGGITTAHTFTMDVIIAAEKRAIEVKAQHVLAKKYACRMERDALADKIAFGKKMGYKLETRLIIIDDSTPDHIMAVYKKAGVGNFDVQAMEFVGSYDRYGKELGIKFDKWGKRVGDISAVTEKQEVITMSLNKFKSIIKKEGDYLTMYPSSMSRNWDGTSWQAQWGHGESFYVKTYAAKQDHGLAFSRKKATEEAYRQYAKQRNIALNMD